MVGRQYTFGEQDKEAILRLVDEWRGQGQPIPQGESNILYGRNVIFGKAVGAIPARSGTTLGEGTVQVYKLDTSAGATTAIDADWQITAYNTMSAAVTADAYVHCFLDNYGTWIVTAEDCSAT